MHFSKVLAMVSLSVVATALPNTPQQKTNCPAENLYCCKSTEVYDLSDPDNRDKVNSLLNQPTDNPGGLAGGIPILSNFLNRAKANVPIKIPIGLECTLNLITNCGSPACCIMGSTTTTDTSSSSGFLSGTLKNGVNVPINVQFCKLA